MPQPSDGSGPSVVAATLLNGVSPMEATRAVSQSSLRGTMARTAFSTCTRGVSIPDFGSTIGVPVETIRSRMSLGARYVPNVANRACCRTATAPAA